MGVEFRGLSNLRRRLKAVGDGRAILGQLQTDTTYEAKKRVARKTGNTGRTIRPGYLTASEALVRANGAAPFLEYGTKPHVIRPKKGKALRFPAAGVGTTLGGRVRTGEVRRLGAGAYVFAGEVKHPGTKPQPFLMPAAKAAAEKRGLRDTVIELWNKAA